MSDKKSFVRQGPTCPPPGGGIRSKVADSGKEKKYKPTISCIMEKTTGTRTGRKPKNDPADRKYSFRLNAEENTRFERLLADSGARDRTLFIKKSIFSGQIKVVRIDKATMDYYIKLTEFHKQFQAIGNNYNQVVRALKNNFGEKRAMSLLYRLEKLSVELMLLCKKITALTQEYERKWLQR
ncbi:conjugal transfer protein MobA [Faecalibacterium sp.]